MKSYNPGTLAFFLGPLTGLLVMSGLVEPAHADEVLQELNLLAGTLITLVSVIGALHHHIELKKLEKLSPVVDKSVDNLRVGVSVGGVHNG